MTTFKRKGGEKAIILSKCGESLFGCPGKMLVTQGIYVPKSVSSKPFHFVCKRTVWVPDSLSYEHLFEHLLSFGAMLPFSVQKVASLQRFGLCGITPTRTLHAIDRHFLLLAKYPHKHFAVYGIVVIREACINTLPIIESISTSKIDVLNHVDWVEREIVLFHLSKESKNKGVRFDKLIEEKSEQEDKSESESESPMVMERTEQEPIQHTSETESETKTSVPESMNIVPYEYVDPHNITFNGIYHQNPSTIYWVPCYSSQNTFETVSEPNPFFFSF